MAGTRIEDAQGLRRVLEATRTVAVVGLSPRRHRPSHQVAAYLQDVGYRIVPVHPAGGEILGEPVYGSLAEAVQAAGPVDLVDVFRRPGALPGLVPEVAAIGPRVLWLQIGVTHAEAEAAALGAGLDLVADRCMLVEHRRLIAGRE